MKTKLTSLKEIVQALHEKGDIVRRVEEEAGADQDFKKVKCLGDGDTAAKVEKLKAISAELSDLSADYRELASIIKARELADEAAGYEGIVPHEQPGQKNQNFGEMFMAHKGLVVFDAGGRARPIKNNPVTLDFDLKANFFIGTPGWVPERLRTGVVTLAATRPLAVVESLPQLPTNTDLVKYMKESTFTNNAAEAAEGDAVNEGTLVLTETSDEVEKIGTFIPVSEEQLEDVPQAQAYLNQRLSFMVLQRLDSQVLEGNGSTPNLLGTLNLAALQSQALGSDTRLDCLYKAFDLIRTVGFTTPTHLFIHPNDWQPTRLARTADGIYILGNPNEPVKEVWGVPVVQTTAVTANTALTGDYLTHSALYIRRGIEVEMSNGYNDFYVKGKFAIKATIRCAMVHYRIPAFAKITGI